MSKNNKLINGISIFAIGAAALAFAPSATINNSFAAEPSSTMGNVVSDSAITAAVKAKLLADKKINGMDISVETVNGVVTLKSSTATKEVADLAVAIAKATDGVKSVNYVALKPENKSSMSNVMSDSGITAAVKAKYLADKRIDGLDINVETINGVVTLKGVVSNAEIKDLVISIAKNTDGVKEVRSEL